jgi:hypothetical protein
MPEMKYNKEAPCKGKEKSPFQRRNESVTKKGFKATEFSVSPVAKDTNKTRRPKIKPTSSRKNTKY